MIGSIAFLPFAISTRAIEARDNFLFQQFFVFAQLLYARATQVESAATVRNLLVDRSWRWPREIVDFHIARHLDAARTQDEIKAIRGFAIFSLRVFQDLLKQISDADDVPAFQVAAQTFVKLYRNFRNDRDGPSSIALGVILERSVDETERASLRQQLAFRKEQDDLAADLSSSIESILLVLTARILARHLESPKIESINKMLRFARSLLPKDLKKLGETFAIASEFRAGDRWGWSLWDLEADGEAHWIDAHTKLNQMFVVQGLTYLADSGQGGQPNATLPVSHILSDMAREGNAQGVLAVLDKIEVQPERWASLLRPEAIRSIGTFRDLLRTARAAYQEEEEDRSRRAVIDADKLASFRNEVAQHFYENRKLNRILQFKGAFEKPQITPPALPSLGYTQIDDKSAFIEQDHTSYVGWGRTYGEGLARSEDDACFAEIIAGAAVRPIATGPDIFGRLEESLKSAILRDPVILSSLDFSERSETFRNHPAFTARYDRKLQNSDLSDIDGFLGVLLVNGRHIPVFEIFTNSSATQNYICLVDLPTFAMWKQYSPSDRQEDQEFIVDDLLIRVSDLNDDEPQRLQILAQDPDWLRNEPDKDRYLRGRVLVNIYERFSVEIVDPNAAICLQIKPQRAVRKKSNQNKSKARRGQGDAE